MPYEPKPFKAHDGHTPIRQLPAREAAALGIHVPYFVHDESKPIQYHLQLALIDRETLNKLVIMARKKAAELIPSETDNRNGNLDYPATNRELVNFLRHSGLNRTVRNFHQLNGYSASYDAILYRIEKKGIDVAARQLDFKLSVLRLIATYYPDLALECEYQRHNLLKKADTNE